MVRWHRDKAKRGWLRHAAVDAERGDRGRRGACSRTDTAIDECSNTTTDRVAMYRFDTALNYCILFILFVSY